MTKSDKHSLQNTLAALLLYAGLIENEATKDSERAVRSYARHISTLVTDLSKIIGHD
jgi:hypothetical protein